MKIIFTDIDGVLNPNFTKKWNKKCINIYNNICQDFNLSPVITSTWKIRYNKSELQEIFYSQGIKIKIFDFTPNLGNRGLEIKKWLKCNNPTNYIIIDDKIKELKKLKNIIKCHGWVGKYSLQ